MPLLSAETDLFPADLLDTDSSISDRKWWAVHTKPRQEKSLARQLEGLNVPFYLPLVKQQSFTSGRRMVSYLPLFTSYVFVHGTEEERVQTLATKRVVHMLSAADQAAMTADLINVRKLIACGAPLTIESRLMPGRRVRVKTGALMGLEGVVVARRGEESLLVAVKFLQQGVSIQISDFQVEPL